jgi:hypothetical protein
MLNRCGRVLEVFYPCMAGEGQTLVADPEERLWRTHDNLKNVFHLMQKRSRPPAGYVRIGLRQWEYLLSFIFIFNLCTIFNLSTTFTVDSISPLIFPWWEDFACLELAIDSFKN